MFSCFHDFSLFLPLDELTSCLDCDGSVGGLCEDSSSSGTVRRSLSAPHPPTVDPISSLASYDFQSKYHCDLVARNGSDVYRYPSPLHAVAVQSPVLLQMLGHGGYSRDECVEGLKPESSPVSAPLVPQSSSWPPPFSSSRTPSHKRLDSYIYSLVQRRALSVRTSRPRTSILRQASLCVRQVSGPNSGSGLGTLRGSGLKPSRQGGGASTERAATSSSQRQWTVESQSEEQENQNVFPDGSVDVRQHCSKINNTDLAPIQSSSPLTIRDVNPSPNSLLKKKRLLPSSLSTATLPKNFRELGSPKANSPPKETKHPCYPPDQKVLFKSPPAVKTQPATPETSPNPPQTGPAEKVDRSVQEVDSLGSSSQSQEEAGGGGGSHMVNAKCIPAQQENIKLCKGGSKNVKTVKVKTTTTMKMSRVSEHNEPSSERRGHKSHHRSSSKRSWVLEERPTHSKGSKTAAHGGGPHGVSSSRIRRLPASIPEGRVPDKHTTSTLSASRYHHHGNHNKCGNHHHHHHAREQVVVVAKPKYKRNDYRRLRAIMEVPCDEAVRRTQRRQRKELLSHSATNRHHPSTGQLSSPYANMAGSDSEYSAECASLFHSTIVDTSEDERSNYTTNCFGDSESSEEYVEESTTTSDTEESGGGGAGMGPAQAKAFIKIKASHNLKKKILRFRSGSLKLMTTV